MRPTVWRTRACTTSSVSSSSSKITTSFTLRTPRFRSSPSADDFANHDGRARNRLQHAHLPALDALGDFDFAFARQQRHGAHLAQVHAHGVVGFFERSRGQVELDILALFASASKSLSPPNFGPPSSRSMPWVPMVVIRSSRSSAELHVSGQHVVHLAVGEIALLLARIDQVLNVVFEFVFNRQARHVSRVKCVRICLLGSDEMRSRPLRRYPRSEAMSPGGRRTSTKDLQNIMPRHRTGAENARREPNFGRFLGRSSGC